MAKLISVFGATGAQGEPIAITLLQNGFRVRVVTRNPDSKKAKALIAAGADEAVHGNYDDVESLKVAITGAYGVFYITNYWELFAINATTAYEREIAQGKVVADVCKAAGIQHVVYSGGDAVKEKTGTPCPHLDAKAVVEKYIDEIGLPNTIIRYAFYYENFMGFFLPERQDDGTYSISLPMVGRMDAIAVADGAYIVLKIFENPKEYLGKKLSISGSKKTISEYAAVISSVTGKKINYIQVPFEQFANQPNNPMASELAGMFKYFSNGNPSYNVELTRNIYPGVLTFQQWAEKNKDRL